ncbi:hypothetical protein [Rhodohalobacter sp.]|uniref:hypothetical protein n=1 Tax=Rhodohalobacter sp. TaxID=1974210 RepID=UPI002ACD6397|nr:hypothetical protein [Rhodohalobacter sp.]MDZ7757529.1 hypothetical protein [Rhodohalobacter sp.]
MEIRKMKPPKMLDFFKLQVSLGNDDLIIEAPKNEGAEISNESLWETVRCIQNPIRYLTQIDIKAYDINGSVTILPPIKFEYNDRLDLSLPLSNIPHENPIKNSLKEVPGFGQEGINAPYLGGLKATLLDINSDGIKDRVSVIKEDRVCTLVWNKGLNSGSFEEKDRKSALPTAAWYDEWRGNAENVFDGKEGCTLSGQVAYRSVTVFPGDGTSEHVLAPGHVNYNFMDYTGDGKLDAAVPMYGRRRDVFGSYEPWTTNTPENPECSLQS